MRKIFLILLLGFACVPLAWAEDPAPQVVASEAADEPAPLPTIELHEYVVLPTVGHYGRLPVHRDAVEAQLVGGHWKSPEAGDRVEIGGGQTKAWRAATADDGLLETRTIRGGYAFTKFHSPAERVMLLEAAGHAAAYVNGELRAGDPYSLGWLRLPVLVREGENTLLFHVAGDRLSARLTAPPADVFFLDANRTLPALVAGETDVVLGAIPVVNATREWIRDAQVECDSGSGETTTTNVAPIAPLSVVKVPFEIQPGDEHSGPARYTVRLTQFAEESPLAETTCDLRFAGAGDVHVRTFRSRVDGSIQPYAVRPAKRSGPSPVGEQVLDDAGLPGTIVSLHEAAVDCAAQAAEYKAKDWAHVVVPNGRGNYGFDWEDWSRIDCLEAMADARKRYPANSRRTFLTGQAMGGHGVWHLGVTFPDRFAAIGPIGGWASFWSYGGGMPTFQSPTPIESLLLRSCSASDTVQLLSNLANTGVYVLHDGADITVPVAQARFMRSRLAGFHTNFAYFENASAGASAEESADWPPMMEFFKRSELPPAESQTIVDFATANPGVSSRYGWLAIEAQLQPLAVSRVVMRQDVDTRSFVGQTTNVARLAIDVAHLPPGQPIDVSLDGQQLDWIPWPEEVPQLWFARTENDWEVAPPPSPRVKGPARNGMFKSVFDRDVLLVYGTGGTDEEDRWAEAKARYDAETFLYRGNGHLEVVPDTEFDPIGTIGRNVVLYGNADTNAAWSQLLGDCPVQVRRGEVRVGERTETGDGLAVLMVYPRSDSEAAVIGVVAGTGSSGMALTNRLRYFVSGIGYPDLMVVDVAALHEGIAGIRAWGYFGPDWSTDRADIAWRGEPTTSGP